jgi:hypothetical protein
VPWCQLLSPSTRDLLAPQPFVQLHRHDNAASQGDPLGPGLQPHRLDPKDELGWRGVHGPYVHGQGHGEQ